MQPSAAAVNALVLNCDDTALSCVIGHSRSIAGDLGAWADAATGAARAGGAEEDAAGSIRRLQKIGSCIEKLSEGQSR